MEPEVEYRPVAEFPAYRVGSDGSVWSRWKQYSNGIGLGSRWVISEEWKLLKQSSTRYGYACVSLNTGERRIVKVVHAIVAKAFLGERPKGMDVCHFNGIKKDNHVVNLRYDTRKGNFADSIRLGQTSKGSSNGSAKLNEKKAVEIRALYAKGGVTQKELGVRYGVGHGRISLLLARKTWRHV